MDYSNPNLMTWSDIIAGYAAFLSTALAIWNVRSARPQIKVELYPGMNENLQGGVYLYIKNPSSHTIHLTYINLLYPYRKDSYLKILSDCFSSKRISRYFGWVHTALVFDGVETGIPISLMPHNSHRIFIPQRKIDEMLTDSVEPRFAAQVQDALLRSKYSAPFTHKVGIPSKPDTSRTRAKKKPPAKVAKS